MKKKYTIISLVLVFLFVASLTTCIVVNAKNTNTVNRFIPPKFDKSAVAGSVSAKDVKGYSEFDAKGVYKVGVCGLITLNGSGIDVYFSSPSTNKDVWLKLRVLDSDGKILGETGLIKPGQYLKTMALKKVPTATKKVTLKVMSYVPGTYESKGAVSLDTTLNVG